MVVVLVAASRAAWCTPTSLSQRSSRTKRAKAPSWTSRGRWLYDRDTGLYYFYADKQENSIFSMTFIYGVFFSSKGKRIGGNCVVATFFLCSWKRSHHHDSLAMVTNPPEGLWVDFFFFFFKKNICILILYM